MSYRTVSLISINILSINEIQKKNRDYFKQLHSLHCLGIDHHTVKCKFSIPKLALLPYPDAWYPDADHE